jgi:transposase-like protein
MSLMEFMQGFPDDAACLEWLWRERCSEDGTHADCPKCKQRREFKRYATKQRRQSWTCVGCGHHVHPPAGTIFHGSSTSLHLWFYGFYLMTSTRCGISAKQLERELGVNHKTAWRMLNKIRNELMADDGEALSGSVEADETYVGGRRRRAPSGRPNPATSHKQPVFGMVERRGNVAAYVVPDAKTKTVMAHIEKRVLPQSIIYTDEWQAYWNVGSKGYTHRRIYHAEKVYVRGDVHTNTIEGFFSLVKSGIRGTYHAVSRNWLQGYLNEYAWRYNHRDDERAQFQSLLLRAARD